MRLLKLEFEVSWVARYGMNCVWHINEVVKFLQAFLRRETDKTRCDNSGIVNRKYLLDAGRQIK